MCAGIIPTNIRHYNNGTSSTGHKHTFAFIYIDIGKIFVERNKEDVILNIN
jgi:hypothetical protein